MVCPGPFETGKERGGGQTWMVRWRTSRRGDDSWSGREGERAS